IDDEFLQVKLCYICREEEPYDAVCEGPARLWIHPCNCTLIAHESCLLDWIQSSQGGSQERAQNALKCPQCGTNYEMESKSSPVLQVLSTLNRILQRFGGMFTLVSVAGVIGVMGSGIYITLTAYGAWAVQQFFGKEMFDMLLTDDPANWPWTAFLQLPLLPMSLVSSRLSNSPTILPMLLPLLLVWPPTPVAHQWMHHEPWHKRDRPHSPKHRGWPPSPIIFGLFIAPMVKLAYRRLFHRVAFHLLGANLSNAGRNSRLGFYLREGPFFIRFRTAAAAAAAGGPEAVAPNPNNANANANEPPQDPDARNLERAERMVERGASSLGRRVAGALLIPYISNLMGSLLFRLSKHSHILREFLGIRPHRRLLSGLPPSVYAYPGSSLNSASSVGEAVVGTGLRKLGQIAKFLGASVWGGTKTWAEFDPVWWRNSIGLGLFIVARDCLYLAHLWFTKREIESRKIKSRNFAGVDMRELDLVPSFPIPFSEPRRTSGAEIASRALGRSDSQ
ncbi:E3 ubiquitin-protein ligase MARCH5, partial [Leucoagaricus sp. SymC.cos]